MHRVTELLLRQELYKCSATANFQQAAVYDMGGAELDSKLLPRNLSCCIKRFVFRLVVIHDYSATPKVLHRIYRLGCTLRSKLRSRIQRRYLPVHSRYNVEIS